jgi:hypothetical protein
MQYRRAIDAYGHPHAYNWGDCAFHGGLGSGDSRGHSSRRVAGYGVGYGYSYGHGVGNCYGLVKRGHGHTRQWVR